MEETRHADKQLLHDDGSALVSMPRVLEQAALGWVCGRRVREGEVELSLERYGAFFWNPRGKKAFYSRGRSSNGKETGNGMTHLGKGKEVGCLWHGVCGQGWVGDGGRETGRDPVVKKASTLDLIL